MTINNYISERKIKLIGLDLDGTVLNNNKEITKTVAQAIENAIIKGVTVVPVTGRPLTGLPEAMKNIRGMKYAITSNGAVTVDMESSEIIKSCFLPEESIEFMLELADKYQCIYSIFVNGMGYSETAAHKRLIDMFTPTPLLAYVNQSRRSVTDIRSFLKDETEVNFSGKEKDKKANINCVENFWICCREENHCDIIENTIRKGFPELNVHRMMKMDVEMVAPDADKGDAFLELAALLGIKPEETAAIGDSINDIGFMKKAGLSIAMDNAEDAIKCLSDYITADNEHDGVAIAINKILG